MAGSQTPALIVLEGIDGSGKSTQAALLTAYLRKLGHRTACLHFPQLDLPPHGELIFAMLRGEPGLGPPPAPRLAALLFALNRADSRAALTADHHQYLIIDRYVHSNVAYQAARETDLRLRADLRPWILAYEFDYLKLPRPDLVIYLEVIESFRATDLSRKAQVAKPAHGPDEAEADVYEADRPFQQQVAEEFRRLSLTEDNFTRLECYHGSQPLLPEEVHHKITALLAGLGHPKAR